MTKAPADGGLRQGLQSVWHECAHFRVHQGTGCCDSLRLAPDGSSRKSLRLIRVFH